MSGCEGVMGVMGVMSVRGEKEGDAYRTPTVPVVPYTAEKVKKSLPTHRIKTTDPILVLFFLNENLVHGE